MRTLVLKGALAAGIILVSVAGRAQDKGYWRAASSSASSITGDIAISGTKVQINFSSFVLAPIRTLTTSEVAAAFDADVNGNGTGNLYRLTVPATKRFLHHNTLCGTEDTQWMATYAEDKTLQVAFFSGASTPVLTMDALSNSTDLCGTYTYVK